MTQTTRNEYATANVLKSELTATPVPVDERAVQDGSLQSRIRSGQAYLKVVAYPWGVEFEVLPEGEQP